MKDLFKGHHPWLLVLVIAVDIFSALTIRHSILSKGESEFNANVFFFIVIVAGLALYALLVEFISGKNMLEKARVFDSFGHNKIDPLKVLAAGVNFILPQLLFQAFFALSFRMLSPVSSMEWAEWTIRSRIASATVGSPTMSYQLDDGY